MKSLPLLVTNKSHANVVAAMGRELGLGEEETKTAVELFDRSLPPLTRPEWLPFLFGVSPKLIGAMSGRSERYYRRFSLRKRSGGIREIVTPRRFLKTIQRWLLHHVFPQFPQSEYAHGFVAGRSIFSNAAPHLGGKNLLAADVRDFFPSVSKSRVEELLRLHLPYPPLVVKQLSGLCTLDRALPQGAPTSPALANAAFHGADSQLAELAGGWGCQYTRYADDLAISGERNFDTEDIESVRRIISDAEFSLHEDKTRVVGSGRRQVVAGVVVNDAGLPPRPVRRRWRAMFHRADRFPREFVDRVPTLTGVASFVNQYSPELAVGYFGVADRVRETRDADALR